jgi:hypothetical protein
VGAECGGRRRGGRDAEAIAEALISSSSALQKEKTVEADKGMVQYQVLDCAAKSQGRACQPISCEFAKCY